MAGVLQTVDQRTKLAGENRLELLLFQLETKQLYGINVFKVREIIQNLSLTKIPGSNPVIRGISNMRGQTFPIFDLSLAICGRAVEDFKEHFIIITEYNQSVQGFLVKAVNRIVNLNWEEIRKPPAGTGKDCYLTAVTNVDNHLVEVIDVEKVLEEVNPSMKEISKEIAKSPELPSIKERMVLICDDSRVARTQIKNTLQKIGLEVVERTHGREALDLLKEWAGETGQLPEKFLLLLSDIEMPEMDGYKLTTEIKNNPRLKNIHVVLHSSLSGVFNSALVEKVGADKFIAKFDPDAIAKVVMDRFHEEIEEKNKKK